MSEILRKKIYIPVTRPVKLKESDVTYPRDLPLKGISPVKPNPPIEFISNESTTDRRFKVLARFAKMIPNDSISYQQLMDSSSTTQQAYHLSLLANGIYLDKDGDFQTSSEIIIGQRDKNSSLESAIFGQNGNSHFSQNEQLELPELATILYEDQTRKVLHKQFLTDPSSMVRLAYLLGGMNRIMYDFSPGKRYSSSHFTSEYISLGKTSRSREAIGVGLVKYVLSGGELRKDELFPENIARAAGAIDQESLVINSTSDLGFADFLRLKRTLSSTIFNETEISRMYSEYKMMADNYPNTNAVFYVPKNHPDYNDSYRLANIALINILQYHPGSPVELAIDNGKHIVIETSPSIEPVTSAMFHLLSHIQPLLLQSYSTIGISRPEGMPNYNSIDDSAIISPAIALSRVAFASKYHLPQELNYPENNLKGDVINLGDAYYDQTFRVNKGRFYSGQNQTDDVTSGGRLSIFSGYGESIKILNYYLANYMANPRLNDRLAILQRVHSLADAKLLTTTDRRRIFDTIQQFISKDTQLRDIETKAISLYKELMS